MPSGSLSPKTAASIWTFLRVSPGGFGLMDFPYFAFMFGSEVGEGFALRFRGPGRAKKSPKILETMSRGLPAPGSQKSEKAKGTPISEPRFSTPCEMRFFPREKGKMAFVEGLSLKRPFSLSRVGKIASRRGWKIGAHYN